MLHNNQASRDTSYRNQSKRAVHEVAMSKLLSRLPIDPYILAILAMVGLASLEPARGVGAVGAGYATDAAIALLFFLHGARLQPQAALAGARHWRLHVVVFLSTFGLFPALGLAARAVAPGLLTGPLWTGVLLLCVLPSTVQSSIAFTSIARGNVPAALCAATASNLLGILLTPLLAGLLLQRTRRVLDPRGRRRGAAVPGAVRRGAACAALDWLPGPTATRRWSAWSTVGRFC